MLPIVHIFLFIVICSAQERLDEDFRPVIEPPALTLNSTAKQAIFFCHVRVNISEEKARLVASISPSPSPSTALQLTTTQINQTSIRIVVSIDNYVGINRINCHWNNDIRNGIRADLIVGAKPGTIGLKSCSAYDGLYVLCTFVAPVIAQAFRNGFPWLYHFSALNAQDSNAYTAANLTKITANNELVFRFEPRDFTVLSKTISQQVNMTIDAFGSSHYNFNMIPNHVTNVEFTVKAFSWRLIILINHNNTGIIGPRLCSGEVLGDGNGKKAKYIQTIPTTPEQKLTIYNLKSSTDYRICLRCYYNVTDKSYEERICQSTRTQPMMSMWTIGTLIIALAISVVGLIFLRRSSQWRRVSQCGRKPKPRIKDLTLESPSEDVVPLTPVTRYFPEPTSTSSRTLSLISDTDNSNKSDDYRPVDNLQELLFGDKLQLSPDTKILS